MSLTSGVREHRSLVLGSAVMLPLLVCAALSGFRETVASATAVLVLVLLVVVAAATGDRVAGIVAALSSGAWFDFFLTEPYGKFTITDSEDVEATILLVLIGLAVTEVALWGRRQQARASRRAGYLDGVLSTAEIVSVGHESLATLIDLVAGQIVEVLGIATCRFVSGPVYDSRLAILDHDGEVTRGGHLVMVERDGLPTDEETALLVIHEGETVGHFVLTSASDVARPSLEQRRVAVLMADQVASVLGKPAQWIRRWHANDLYAAVPVGDRMALMLVGSRVVSPARAPWRRRQRAWVSLIVVVGGRITGVWELTDNDVRVSFFPGATKHASRDLEADVAYVCRATGRDQLLALRLS